MERARRRGGERAVGGAGARSGCARRAPTTCASSRSATSHVRPRARARTSPPAALGRAGCAALRGARVVRARLSAAARSGHARLLPRGEGANVVARVPARGERAADAGPGGPPRRRAHRSDLAPARWRAAPRSARPAPSFALPPGWRWSPWRSGRAGCGAGARARAGARGGALARRRPRRRRCPGANDNATGVAGGARPGARASPRDPLDRTEVIAVLPGARGVGHGRDGRLAGRARGSTRATTLVLGLDTLGAGEPHGAAARRGRCWRVATARRTSRWPTPARAAPGSTRRGAFASAAGPTRSSPAWPGCRRSRCCRLRGRRLPQLPPADRHARPGRLGQRRACLEIAEATAREWAEG